MTIKGMHALFYTSDAEATRAFIRDKLGLRWAVADSEGWLIFEAPEADLGCHPAMAEDGGKPGSHNVSFYCDDIEASVTELRERGVEFIDEVTDRGYGLAIRFRMPGGVEVELYEPRYRLDFQGEGPG